MANKPIIQIDVDDAAFKRFNDLFEKYAAKVDEMPAAWKKLDAAMNGAGKEFVKGAAATNEALAIGATSATLIVEAIERASKAQVEFRKVSEKTGGVLDRMAASAKGIAGAFAGMKKILEYGGIGGALLGAGGALGVVDLAGAAMSRQTAARGAGVSTGMLSSFNINMQQFSGSAVLQNAANAQFNPAQYSQFAALGIPISQAQSESPAVLAMQEMDAARRLWRKNPQLAMAYANQGLLGGMGAADLRNLGATSDAKWAQIQAQTFGDASRMNIGNPDAWTDFEKKLQEAGVAVQTSLTNALTKLIPPLTQLTDRFTAWLSAFASSPNFQKDITDFANNAILLGKEIGVIVKKFAWLLPSDTTAAPSPASNQKPVPFNPADPSTTWPPALRAALGMPPVTGRPPSRWNVMSNNWTDLKDPSTGNFANYASAQANIVASKNQLLRDYNVHGLKTLARIIGDPKWGWAPASDGNNVSGYLANLKKWTGIDPNAPLNLNDPATMDAVISGIIRQEHSIKVGTAQIARYLGQTAASPFIPARSIHLGNPRGAQPSRIEDLMTRLVKQGLVKQNNVTITNYTAAQVHRSANAAAAGG